LTHEFIRNLAQLESLCEAGVSEGLHVEFKVKEDSRTATLSRVDKRNIAEAVSSFANSDGGTLIYGIGTTKRDGLDVASTLDPITNLAEFAVQFALVTALNVSPELEACSTHVIAADEEGSGYLVCEVKRSDRRPHMSTAPGVHSYYRRSFNGSALMTPSEIRDQILAVRDAILQPVSICGTGNRFVQGEQWISGRVPITFRLKNVGRALCRNPFLRAVPNTSMYTHLDTFDGALNAWKTLYPADTFIHVGDQINALNLQFNVVVRLDVLGQLFSSRSNLLTPAVLILPGSEEIAISTVTDKVSQEEITFDLTYGAENAVLAETRVRFGRDRIASQVLMNPSFRAMAVQSLGVFHADLVSEFVEKQEQEAVTE
jgi:hypothetical protein